jgi:hypothetical protein
MGRFIEDRYEAEFLIRASQGDIWGALERTEQGQPLWLTAFPNLGDGPTGELLEMEAPHRVRVRKVSEPCRDTEIAVVVEAEDNGCRVRVVQSGFPAFVKQALDMFTYGGDQIVADLALYLERGVVRCRHAMPWAFSGLVTRGAPSGLEVATVMPGSYAERVGLAPGDLLLTLGAAPVFDHAGLQTLMRVFPAGTSLRAEWVRGREECSGTAAL